MKKTIIALMALAGVSYGADYTTETVWTLDFGTEYTSNYNLTGTLANKGTFWDLSDCAVVGGATTTASKRIHMAGGVYGSWEDDFQFSITLTLGNTISASNGWPVFAELKGNGAALRFGPYTNNNNTVAVDGNVKKGAGTGTVSVAPGGTYTITLTKIDSVVTLAVDGVTTMTGTLAEGLSGNITDIALGGDTGSQYRINETVHSISWSKVTPTIPEPTTATLSLLALAGLAARRRRK